MTSEGFEALITKPQQCLNKKLNLNNYTFKLIEFYEYSNYSHLYHVSYPLPFRKNIKVSIDYFNCHV